MDVFLLAPTLIITFLNQWRLPKNLNCQVPKNIPQEAALANLKSLKVWIKMMKSASLMWIGAAEHSEWTHNNSIGSEWHKLLVVEVVVAVVVVVLVESLEVVAA